MRFWEKLIVHCCNASFASSTPTMSFVDDASSIDDASFVPRARRMRDYLKHRNSSSPQTMESIVSIVVSHPPFLAMTWIVGVEFLFQMTLYHAAMSD